jgi:hypothetical protein
MRRTITIPVILAAALAASPASAGRIGPGYETSWGKAGVSLEQYWIDSAECGHQAANIDLTGTDPARALILASRMFEIYSGLGSASGMITVNRIGSPEIQWNRAATLIRRDLESCLTGRGYVKFKLTKGQARHLRSLETGTLERRRYLHELASDPDVVTGQALNAS